MLRIEKKLDLKPEIEAFKRRVSEKKTLGKKLSSVEKHLLRCTSLKRENVILSPGIFSSFKVVFKAFLEPIPILLVLVGILAAEAPSAASYFYPEASEDGELIANSSSELYEAFTKEEVQTIKESSSLPVLVLEDSNSKRPEAGLVFASAFGSSQVEPTKEVKESARVVLNPAFEKHSGLIEFISGVIAVYCPSAGDSGAIARNIVDISVQEDMDPLYVASVIAIESRFKSNARSHVGAQGLMQLLPGTAKDVHEKISGKQTKALRLNDPETNIALGINYLKEMHARYKGNRYLALAAYNWGPGKVDEMLKTKARLPKSVENYSVSVIQLSKRWHGHFQKAREHAEELAQALSLTKANS